jgi:hypothetical protein
MYMNVELLILAFGSWYIRSLDWLQHHLFTCPSKKFLHIDCPGCGLQRSFIYLLRGDFGNSWSLYPATVPLILLIGFTLVHLKMKFRYGGEIIKYLQIAIGIIILSFYVYKILNHKLTA